MANEAVIETPRGKDKRANTDVATPAASKRRRSRKDQAQSLVAEAEHLEKVANELAKEASAAEQAAVEALHRATSLRETADAKASEAAAAKTVAAEGRHRAERAELESTKEGRDALKAKDKADKKAAKDAERAQKQQEKEDAADMRTAIKKIGDAIKDSMVICKRGGMWQVPPGSVAMGNVKFSTFKVLFSRGRCAYRQQNFCENDQTIAVSTKDAASIFRSTKVRGGSMYSTWVISELRASFVPATRQLTISYATEMGF